MLLLARHDCFGNGIHGLFAIRHSPEYISAQLDILRLLSSNRVVPGPNRDKHRSACQVVLRC